MATALVLGIAVFLQGASCDLPKQELSSRDKNDSCDYKIWPHSKTFFESRLIAIKPNFMHFTLELNSTYNATEDVFRPLHWVWTYKSPTASYPYLHWNIDHGLLSFGLLDAKTVNIPYVRIEVPVDCQTTFGSPGTTKDIVNALKDLLLNMSEQSYHKYEENYFCFLSVTPGIRERFEYTAALYFNYPIQYINYNCCFLWYTYVNDSFVPNCTIDKPKKWIQCTLGPYILGLLIFMYFPIVLLNICAWLSKNDEVVRHDFELQNKARREYEQLNRDDGDWIFLDGKPPKTLLESLGFFFCGLGRNHPIITSRIRRLICICIAPSVIFIQLQMYANGIGTEESNITIPELVERGTPMGFLSLLAKRDDQHKVFAPQFGGPMCLLIMYYILGVVFLVLPRSLKQIVERGMPDSDIASPFFLNVNEIIKLSMLSVSPEPGYENGAAVCKCGIYMVFNKMFWYRAFEIQRERFNLNRFDQSRCACFLKYVCLPIYCLFCLLEIVVCVIFYGIPVFGFVTIMVKGAVKSFISFRLHNSYVSMIFRNIFVISLATVVVLTSFLFFTYAVCLIFVQSFSFISQIIIFCFVSVIVYPSVSFGYLFFFVVLLYYIVRLVKDFGDGYLELLSIAIEKSRDMYSQPNQLHVFDGQLILSNLQVHRIKGIRINNHAVAIPQNVLHQMNNETPMKKVAENNNVYGIPKRLFEVLVQAHRPVHIQVLKILLQLSSIVFLVVITLSITSQFASGATSEISDVMHVVFVVTVGALPRVLEVALMNASEVVKREIQIRCIEQTIKEFWELEQCDGFTLEP